MIRAILLLSIGFTLLLSAKGYKVPQNFSQAKNIIRMIHFDYKTSWLKECPYVYDKTSCMNKMIVDKKCAGKSRVHIEWTHAIAASFYGRNYVCMREPTCKKYDGTLFAGERCCRMTNEKYLKMEADLQNIVPLLSNHDKKPLLEMVSDSKKGDLARIYLYFNDTYGINLDMSMQMQFYKWHKMDPPDAKECAIYKQIKKIQHNENRWLEEGCAN